MNTYTRHTLNWGEYLLKNIHRAQLADQLCFIEINDIRAISSTAHTASRGHPEKLCPVTTIEFTPADTDNTTTMVDHVEILDVVIYRRFRHCPDDESAMRKHIYEKHGAQLIIDKCETCKLVILDKGELKEIIAAAQDEAEDEGHSDGMLLGFVMGSVIT